MCAGIGVQLVQAPGERAALRRLLVAGRHLDRQRLDYLGLGLCHIAEQMLQIDILYFVDRMLVETLPVAGYLDQFIELLRGWIHGGLLL